MRLMLWIVCVFVVPAFVCSQDIKPCGTTVPPTYQIADKSSVWPRDVIHIPIVFHVLWNDPSENISDAQIYDQIEILNRAFYKPEISNRIPAEFRPLVGNPNIRFCLAKLGTNGEAIKGIFRRQTHIGNIGSATIDGKNAVYYTALGGLDALAPDRYINIWVADSKHFVGKASMPNSSIPEEEQGIIINPHYLGSISTATDNFPFHLGKTLIHEMGHFFNLKHIWGKGFSTSCEDDDGIDDTPLQAGPYLGCPFGPMNTCGSNDMYQNYMDFSSDDCLLFFTKGQIEQMHQAIFQFRPGLISSSACKRTTETDNIHLEVDATGKRIQLINNGNKVISGRLQIFQMDGKLIFDQKLNIIDRYIRAFSGLSTGVYLLRFTSEGSILSKKMLFY